ncbi:heparan sulfate glucosamine 3-O-sulfotransferase 1 isoform X1 [Vulpes vulpes]|uniref:Heparan sulfate glucosamine 3-O-sulfotransferase 1 isoform X1 n=1 Tax=Vulpes vulpes TaxID=9627 RepID=A0ABM4YUA7_VULVU
MRSSATCRREARARRPHPRRRDSGRSGARRAAVGARDPPLPCALSLGARPPPSPPPAPAPPPAPPLRGTARLASRLHSPRRAGSHQTPPPPGLRGCPRPCLGRPPRGAPKLVRRPPVLRGPAHGSAREPTSGAGPARQPRGSDIRVCDFVHWILSQPGQGARSCPPHLPRTVQGSRSAARSRARVPLRLGTGAKDTVSKSHNRRPAPHAPLSGRPRSHHGVPPGRAAPGRPAAGRTAPASAFAPRGAGGRAGPSRHPPGRGPGRRGPQRLGPAAAADHHHRGAQGRHARAAGDAQPAPRRGRRRERGALLRLGGALQPGPALVPGPDALLVPAPAHGGEDPRVLHVAQSA